MKKYINYSLFYAIAGLIAGAFYREFTKWNGFTGVTTLGKMHTHLLVLGMVMFMIIALFVKNSDLENQKLFRISMRVYNIGLPLTAIMMLVRGITQVLNTELSKGLSASISGIAGIGHILVAIGIILLLLAIKKSEELRDSNEKLS